MKKIAVVQLADSPCVRLRKVVRELVAAGYHVTYVGCDRGMEGADVGVSRVIVGPAIPSKSNTKIFLMPLWFVNVAKHLRSGGYDFVYAADLEAGLAAYLSGVAYLYDVLDTYADRYAVHQLFKNIIRFIESKVYVSATIGVHVDKIRIKTLKDRVNFHVLENVPRDSDVGCRDVPWVDREYDVMASGNIDKNRGCDLLVEAAIRLRFRLCLVGRIGSEIKLKCSGHPNISLMGYVGSDEALRLAAQSRLMYVAYNPSVAINRMACPNKLYDAIFCGTPVLINEGLFYSESVQRDGVGSVFVWGDLEDLCNSISTCLRQENFEYMMSSINTKRKHCLGWGEQFSAVLKDIRKYV